MENNTIADTNNTSVIKPKSLLDGIVTFVNNYFFKSQLPKVAVLKLVGVIGKTGGLRGGGLTLNDLNDKIEKVFAIKKLKALCLVVNSPGGSPVQSELIASRIINLSKENKIPVYTFVEDVAASGGYWLACAGDKIYSSKSSIIGSIGVISASFGMNNAISKIGIERRVYTSGNNKSVLDPFLPEKKDDIDLIKKIQKRVHEHFIDYVKSRRGGKLSQSDDILFNGEFWTGESALDFGLIDGIDDFHSFIKRKYGKKVKIEYINSDKNWLKRKFSISSKQIADETAEAIVTELKKTIEEVSVGSKFYLY